jgi:large subunit ribosomal protein L10
VPTAKKVESVQELEELLAKATMAIAADYRGLTVAEMTALRRKLGEANMKFQVVKNTLAILAAQKVGKGAMQELLVGPTALAVGEGDQVEATKTLLDYVRTSRLNLTVRGGVMDDRVLNPEQLQTLASLPKKEVLVAQLLGTMQAPMGGLVSALNQVVSSIVYVLDARANQLANS